MFALGSGGLSFVGWYNLQEHSRYINFFRSLVTASVTCCNVRPCQVKIPTRDHGRALASSHRVRTWYQLLSCPLTNFKHNTAPKPSSANSQYISWHGTSFQSIERYVRLREARSTSTLYASCLTTVTRVATESNHHP
jgi:hypothetical protein